jgi:hypothetical protein
VILDNYGRHKHPKTRAWLTRHPRFVFHYTPTSASWLNAVEGFFAKLTKRRLKRGVFCSIVDLQAAINRFPWETNDDPKPFAWTADPDKIIAADAVAGVLLGPLGAATDGTAEFDMLFRWLSGWAWTIRCGTTRPSRRTATGSWKARSRPSF